MLALTAARTVSRRLPLLTVASGTQEAEGEPTVPLSQAEQEDLLAATDPLPWLAAPEALAPGIRQELTIHQHMVDFPEEPVELRFLREAEAAELADTSLGHLAAPEETDLTETEGPEEPVTALAEEAEDLTMAPELLAEQVPEVTASLLPGSPRYVVFIYQPRNAQANAHDSQVIVMVIEPGQSVPQFMSRNLATKHRRYIIT